MLNGIDPALSALRALGKKVEVTANNVANVDTVGFKKKRAIFQEASPSGVTVSIEQVNTPGGPLPPDEGKADIRESSNVAVEEEMVDLIATGHAYTANVKLLKAEDEILGTLFDMLEK
jgi:flagellar basal body rod protein FlgG